MASYSNRNRRAGLLAGTIFCSAFLAMPVVAHDVQDSTVADELIDEIVVTGTHIRGVAPVGSDLSVIDSEALNAIPAPNVVEALNRLPAFSGAGYNAAVKVAAGPGARAGNSSRGSDINLRGIGPRGTLVLFDGARRPPSGSAGYASDTSTMPVLALDRVEVVADGGSAVYGSDAVAGVVNFVPKRSYEGLHGQARYGIADGFDMQSIGLVAGTKWNGGGLILSGETSWQSNLSGADRDYFRSDLRSRGGRDYRSLNCAPGNIIVGGVTYAIPQGGVTAATANQLVAGTANRCEIIRNADLLPEQRSFTLYGAVEHDFGNGLSVYARGVWSERRWKSLETEQGSQALHQVVTVPASNAFFVRPAGTTGPVTVAYNFGSDRGLLEGNGVVKYRSAGTGLEYAISPSWNVRIGYDYSATDDTWATVGIFNSALSAALASSDPATAYNVFGGGGQNAGAKVENLFRNYFDPTAFYRMHEVRAGVDGQLFDLPGGTVRTAFGADWYRLSTVTGNRIGDVLTLAQRPFTARDRLSREVTSVYGEVYVPLVGDGNAMAGIEKLELVAAIRHDNYSDVGSTTNPKIGINWSPVSGITVRGSYGTSFIAPYLGAALTPSIGGALTYASRSDPTSSTGTSVGAIWTDGNANLTPETAETWSIGVDWKVAPGLLFKTTHFAIDYQGQVGSVNSITALQDGAASAFVTRNPTSAQLAAIAATGIRVVGSAPVQADFLIDARNFNLGGTKLAGIDASVQYEWESGASRWQAEIGGTWNYRYTVSALPGASYVDRLDDVFYPKALRTRARLSWTHEVLFAEAFVNYLGGSRNTLVTPVQKVDSYTTFDLRAGVTLDGLLGTLKDTTLSIEALNLFDRNPPFVNVDGGADFTAASPLGRQISITLAVKM